jgi:chemotaxis protein CheX
VESAVHIRREEIGQVAASVFATMMGLEVREVPGPGGVESNPEFVTAAVFLAGAWEGAVLVQCSPHHACELTGCFLGGAPPAEVSDDVRDVLGEIANMIAGNLKCTLCPGIRVSVPSVVAGKDYSLRLCGARLAEQMALETGKGSLRLSIFEVREAA